MMILQWRGLLDRVADPNHLIYWKSVSESGKEDHLSLFVEDQVLQSTKELLQSLLSIELKVNKLIKKSHLIHFPLDQK